jgi:two-component system NtrC family response regulator
VSRAAERVQHPALGPPAGAPLDAAELTDRAKLGVVLQAAGLLSLLEVAGWKLLEGWRPARVAPGGRLTGVAAAPGRGGTDPAPALLALLRSLFGAREEILGRGEARRAAREVAARWAAVLDRWSADRAVDDLLAAAPFLGRDAAARDGLEGALVRDGVEIPWCAGRGLAPERTESPRALAARGRWAEAACAWHARAPESEAERLEFARALAGAGRAEAALAVLAGSGGAAAETLRAEFQLTLGELGAARETVRRLEARDLGAAERLAASDVALRVLGNCGEAGRARDWAERTLAMARGGERTAARLFAALAAGDRGDVEGMARRLEEAAAAADDPRLAARWHEARAQLALARGAGDELAAHAARVLALERRSMRREQAGRAWNNLGLGRLQLRRFAAAERAFAHSARLLRGCDGPLAVTLAASNLADVRLRLGKPEGVEPILAASSAWNRRSGNLRGSVEDDLLWIRWELVGGRFERALERCRVLDRRRAAAGLAWGAERIAVYEARALGWLGRAAEARAALERTRPESLEELEPEELPFLFALAGDADRGLDCAQRSDLAALAAPLVRGESPRPAAWRALDALEAFRRARFAFDAELAAPGTVPEPLRELAAALLRRLGADAAAARLERSRAVAWRALGAYFGRPAEDREALEELLAAVGHPEAELVLITGGEERRVAGGGGRELTAERRTRLGAGELVLRAGEIDEPLRALFALFARDLAAPATAEAGGDSPFLGDSPPLAAALERLRRFAPTGLPVLILGENGTGKELAAHEVHRASGRRGELVPLNCAGLSESLLLSELFGHARGAFTGAERERAGVFETARGGTAFLDEVGDLPASAQGALLRVLQEREVRRLGESLPRRVDVRVIAATNRDLEAMVEQGGFRQDLYYRLKAATVTLPPLRERGADVLRLAEHFVAELRRGRPGLRLSAEARRALAAHAWPGNVRELRNVLEAAAALAAGGRIEPAHLELGGAPPPPAKGARPGDYHLRMEAFRRRLIEEALAETDGGLAAAARRLGVSRQFLSQFVRKYGLGAR